MAPGVGGGVRTQESIASGEYAASFATATLGQGILGTTFGQTANTIAEGSLIEVSKVPVSFMAGGPND